MRCDDRPHPPLAATLAGVLRARAGTHHAPETSRADRTDPNPFVP